MDKTKNWRLNLILGCVCVHLKTYYAVDIPKSYIYRNVLFLFNFHILHLIDDQ